MADRMDQKWNGIICQIIGYCSSIESLRFRGFEGLEIPHPDPGPGNGIQHFLASFEHFKYAVNFRLVEFPESWG